MRNLTTACLLLAVAGFAGCDHRESADTTPDRKGHAAGNPGTNIGQASPGADETVYTVKQGDTLTSIAKAYNTSIERLISRNRIVGDIKPGTRLVVPEPKPAQAH